MKDMKFFNWLIILLEVVAIIGLCFTPALADEVNNPSGVQVQSVDDSTSTQPLGDFETQDDSFGTYYQFTWIAYSDFTPASSNVTFSRTGGYIYRTGGTDIYFWSSIRLPSGAYLFYARVYYYDNDQGNVIASVYRTTPYTTDTSIASCSSSGIPGYSFCNMYPQETIRNGDSMYGVYVGLSSATTNLRFTGVRLYWYRQVRSGLSTPFTDIGSLPSAFQDAIAALYRSGITSGTSATTYGPNNPVTRAQMAVFLSKALGLYWGYPY